MNSLQIVQFSQSKQRLTPEQRIQLRRKRRRTAYLARTVFAGVILLFVILLMLLLRLLFSFLHQSTEASVYAPPDSAVLEGIIQQELSNIQINYLTVNDYSRPGTPLTAIQNIFIHYTANPGTSAAQNRSYFENLSITHETSASAHFIIGYDGEIIQCIPLSEMAYAVKQHNGNSISIECCYLEESGKFTDATYQSLLSLTKWLMDTYNLSSSDILRHYDESGKLCPKYYVENPAAWDAFLSDIEGN